MEETYAPSESNSRSARDDENEVKMDVSSGSPKVATDDPYRKALRHEKVKNAMFVDSDLKRRLEIVETELEKSRKEVKTLRYELAEANNERKEILHNISSLHVQVQYWNSWLGNFSKRLNEKETKIDIKEIYQNREVCMNESENSKEIDSIMNSSDGIDDTITEESRTMSKSVTVCIGVDERVNSVRKSDTEKQDSVAEEPNSVADMLKETAEIAFADSGMAYDENSGLYYDWNSHMYYDPNTHLFYDNDNGIYYYYDHVKKSYVFYSQVDIKGSSDVNVVSPVSAEEKSEGEISSSESETEPEAAPCIRAIVTAADNIKVGTLYLVTCGGTTIGRDKRHRFHVSDKDASKSHATIRYEEKEGKYFIKDDGSINGTFLNDRRLSDTKTESQWFPIKHKDFLKIGSTIFVLHLHRGQETCDDCEPGQVQALLSSVDSSGLQTEYTSLTKEELRKKQLRGLKEKYMVSGDGLKQALKPIISGKYKDRANKRRRNIGSEPIKDDIPPQMEEPSSVRKMIPLENKGHQMMQKMGWKVGEGLGKERSGIKEPINVVVRERKKGLGSGVLHSIDDSTNQKIVNQKWKKAKQRYDNIIKDEKDLNYETHDISDSSFDF